MTPCWGRAQILGRQVGRQVSLTTETRRHARGIMAQRIVSTSSRNETCPVCNLHLQTFSRAHQRLRDEGVLTVAFFLSTEQMKPYQGQLPFPCVADPGRRWYDFFGVERALFAVAHPRVIGAALKGLIMAPSNPFVTDQTGLPADILVDQSNMIVAARYGSHANDQWDVDEVLALAGRRAS